MTGSASAGLAAFGFGLANGWNDALFYVLVMEASDPRMPASTCALFMSVTNLSVIGGGVFAAGRLGLRRAATGRSSRSPAALALVALPLIPTLRRAGRRGAPGDRSADPIRPAGG